jgi:hypothetical protein
MKTIKLDGKTKDQIANVMLQCGTPKQQKESIEYCTIKTINNYIKMKPQINVEGSLKDDIIDLEKLDIEDGTIIILKVDSETYKFKDQISKKLRMILKELRKKIFFFILNPNQEISTLNQEEMEKFGWIRKEKAISDFRFLLSLAPEWTKIVPRNLDPTFYTTLTYEGDLAIKERVDKIREFVKGD